MYYSLGDVSLYINFFYFVFSLFIAFFIPGFVFLNYIKIGKLEKTVLSFFLGMSLFILQSFIFGFLHLRFLTYVYLFGFTCYWFYKKYFKFFQGYTIFPRDKKSFILLSIVLAGSFLQTTTMWMNGILVKGGLFFCCGDNLDTLFHVSLTNQLVKTVPPFQAGLYPEVVVNYHYLSNLLMADIIRVFKLPLIPVLFQYSTIFISLFLGLGAISFSKINKMSFSFTAWLLFFLYFGGDFIFLTLILVGKEPTFSINALEHGALFLANPPRAYAVAFFFGFLALFSIWLKDKKHSTGFMYALIAGTLIGLKVYIGIYVLFGLLILSIVYLFQKQVEKCIPILLTFGLSFLYYLPVNRNSGGIYYTGFWLFENFIVQPALGLDRLELARNVYKEHGNKLRVIQYELMYIALYVFSIFGTKIIAFLQTRKSLSLLPKEVNIILISGVFISLILGFFFQQESGGANSFNFIVSVIIIGSIYAAISASYWIPKFPKVLVILAVVLLVLLTIPRVTNQLIFNTAQAINQNWYRISSSELQLYEFIKNNTLEDSLILVDPEFSDSDDHAPYVSFFTNRNMYLSGRGILVSHNIPVHERIEARKIILTSGNREGVAKALQESGITHMIVVKDISEFNNGLKNYSTVIFTNRSGKIIKINSEKLSRYLLSKTYEVD